MTLPGDKKPAPGGTFSGNVTCLRVQGNRATVGAVGSDAGVPTTALFVFVDGGPNWLPTEDKVDWTETPGTDPARLHRRELLDPQGPVLQPGARVRRPMRAP